MSNRTVRPYEGRLGTKRPPALAHSGQQVEAAVGIEPTRIRFAGGALKPFGHTAMVCLSLPRTLVAKRQVRTLGRIRTAGLNVRNVALCSAELRGWVRVRAEGFEPPQRRAAGLQPAPTLLRWRARLFLASGCLTGFEPVLPESQSGALPLSYSHHRYSRAYPRRDLNPQPSVCRTVALPLSYTGRCGTYPGLELNQRPPSYQDGALPLSYQDGSEGWQPRCLARDCAAFARD